MSIVSNNIKRILSETGIKQKVVAERASISEKSFSNMVCGRKNILAEDIPIIANALNVTVNELFRPV